MKTIEKARDDFHKAIAVTPKDVLEKARDGAYGIAAYRFACRYADPKKDQKTYTAIYNIYFEFFEKLQLTL